MQEDLRGLEQKRKKKKMTEHGKENFEKNMNTEDGVIFKGERMQCPSHTPSYLCFRMLLYLSPGEELKAKALPETTLATYIS